MRSARLSIFAAISASLVFAEDAAVRQQVEAAIEQFKTGEQTEAVEKVTSLLKGDDNDFSIYLVRAQMRQSQRDFRAATSDYSAALKIRPDSIGLYQARGEAYFRNGQIAESLKDFDTFLKDQAQRAPYHWQRGISLYYARKFKEGVAQFDLHKSVNPNDVENSVWHFLCNVPLVGLEKARSELIPIQQDTRIPMMKVLDMFAGKATPDDVLARAREGEPPAHRLKNQLFYAHLYIGLYYEALGKEEDARKHVKLAATEYFSPHYMGDVAKVHWNIIKQPK